MSGLPLDVEDVRSRVQRCLDLFLAEQAPRLAAISPELAPFSAALADFLRGGKRLRPAFAYWGWRGAGGASGAPADSAGSNLHPDPALAAAASLELLQACALVHDDVMDASDTRRGLPAVHRRFAMLHRENGWLGSSDSFGTGAAILLGDLCLSWADELLYGCGLTSAALLRAKPVYDLMRTELMAGQYLDLLEQARGGGSVERAMTVVRYKSAKYTIERPLHLGGALAGAEAALLAAYSAYGLPLGEAFQLRDDVLGVFGDPERTGKPAGDDVREGKRTVLVAITSERATPAQAALLRHHLGDPDLGPDGLTQVRHVIEVTGALKHVEDLIARLTEQAMMALDGVDLDEVARDVLLDLAYAATTRTV